MPINIFHKIPYIKSSFDEMRNSCVDLVPKIIKVQHSFPLHACIPYLRSPSHESQWHLHPPHGFLWWRRFDPESFASKYSTIALLCPFWMTSISGKSEKKQLKDGNISTSC